MACPQPLGIGEVCGLHMSGSQSEIEELYTRSEAESGRRSGGKRGKGFEVIKRDILDVVLMAVVLSLLAYTSILHG